MTNIFIPLHARIQEFSSVGGGGVGGGGPGQSGKKALSTFFLVLSLFYRSQMVNFRHLSFFEVPEGVQHFPGGPTFSRGGSNCFIETRISCNFPEGPDPLPPPLDPHLLYVYIELCTKLWWWG